MKMRGIVRTGNIKATSCSRRSRTVHPCHLYSQSFPLFTEDVKLRHDQDQELRPASSGSSGGFFPLQMTPASGPTSPLLNPNGHPHSMSMVYQNRSRASSSNLPVVPPLSLDPPANDDQPHRSDSGRKHIRRKSEKRKSVHPDIVARATVDTTIAIIPATAFHRLTRVYPKATAHIVQVILTRLQRVTLATAHSYLGLTSEVLRTERHMNRYTSYDLPNHLRGTALERLKDKFMQEKERLDSPEDSMKGIALHNPRIGP